MVNYDAKTENGIPYLSKLYTENYEYERVVTDLDSLATTRKVLMSGSGGVTQYSLGSRSVTRQAMSASEMLAMWDKLWARKLELEGTKKPRKAIGVVMRDW
jgi:hypothetical protein